MGDHRQIQGRGTARAKARVSNPAAPGAQLCDPYVDGSGRITGYGVADLRNSARTNWRLSKRNVLAVEQLLINMPHAALRTSDQRHEQMLRRFIQFKEAHPNKPFTAYKGREKWM